MSDYSERGALPVEDAAVPDPPTIDEVLAERDRAREEQEPDDAGEGGEAGGATHGGARPSQADDGYDQAGDNPLASVDDDD